MRLPRSQFKDDTDRISSLPREVKDLIIELLPVRDAARTCVLSSKWRYVWSEQPTLILDNKFWNDIKKHSLLSGQTSSIDFAYIVSRILLCHTGNVHKFVIDISVIWSERHCDINMWLSVVVRRGVKELSIMDSVSNDYPIPSCVFYTLELTSLTISKSFVKAVTMETCTGFSNLQSLTLCYTNFGTCVLVFPHLICFELEHCSGVNGFNITAPKLETLRLRYNDYLNLTPYLVCTSIEVAWISIYENVGNNDVFEGVNLLKLLTSWPDLDDLRLSGSTLKFSENILWPDLDDLHDFLSGGSALKYFTTGLLLDKFSHILKVTYLMLSINIDEAAWIFRIIGNSPVLETLEIWLSGVVANNNSEALKYVEEPSIINTRMEKLHTVKIRFFKGTRSEIQFVKTLLHCAPSLQLMLVEENKNISANKRIVILKELLDFKHAYPIPKIFFG